MLATCIRQLSERRLKQSMITFTIEHVAATLFAVALLHTFAAKQFDRSLPFSVTQRLVPSIGGGRSRVRVLNHRVGVNNGVRGWS